MDDDEASASKTALSAPFPDPPSFYEHFTTSNLALYDSFAHRKDAISRSIDIDAQSLPEELHFLRPPAPPADGVYRSFGETRSIANPRPVPPSVIEPPLAASPQSFITLTRSLLLNFLELLSILSQDAAPTSYGPKWEDLRDLFTETHRILTLYKPWQARQALIELMEQMIQDGDAEDTALREATAKVRATMQEVAGLRHEVHDVQDVAGEQMNRFATHRDGPEEAADRIMWRKLEEKVAI